MSVKSYQVRPVSLSVIRALIETLHYSHSVNGLKVAHCFGLYDADRLIGGMLYGAPAMRNAWKKYASSEEALLELRRLVVIDETPKNAESYFIGRSLRWLKQNTQVETIVSYADNTHNHKGTIYRASNFKYLGETPKGKMISWNGKLYHDKSIRTFYTTSAGEKRLKPFAQRIRTALENGDAHWVPTQTKNIFVYSLRSTPRASPPTPADQVSADTHKSPDTTAGHPQTNP